MRMRTLVATAMFAFQILVPLAAEADVGPPPPDPYSGPAAVHAASLTFKHVRGYHEFYVVLTDCEFKSPNCARAKKAGAIGGKVTKIDGVAIEGDAEKIGMALGHRGKHILTIKTPIRPFFDTAGVRTFVLDVRVP